MSADVLPWERRAVAAIALAALLLRLYLQLLAPTIAADAAYYLYSAELMRRGEFRLGLHLYGLHPLFPLLTSLWSLPLETTAAMVSLAASTAVVWPLFALFRPAWGPRTAAAACLVYALHPILAEESAEALPTGLFLFFFVSALAAGLRAIGGGRWFLFPLSGLCAGLAYLTRTEGLMAGLLLAGAAAAAARRAPRSRVLLGAAAAFAVGAAVSTPYVAEISRQAGRFTITGKGGGTVLLQAVTGQKVDVEAPAVRHGFWAIVPRKLAFAFTPVLLPFLAAGLWIERAGARRHLGGLARGCLALAPPIALTAVSLGYRPSHRYFLAGVLLFLPWIAAAMLALVEAAGRRRKAAGVAAAAALAILLAARSVLPHRPEERAYRDAGAWLKERRPDRLVSSSDKLSWYAGARHVPFSVRPEQAAADTLRLCRESAARWLAVDSGAFEDAGGEGLVPALEAAGFTPEGSFTRSGRGRTLTVRLWTAPKP